MSADDLHAELLGHLPAMRAFAISLTGNATLADDIVQDTVVKAWTHFDQYNPGTNLRAWLFAILRNTFYSHLRNHAREVEDVGGLHAARLVSKPAHDGRIQLNEVLAAFEKLSMEQREVLVLVGVSGFSYQEAAEVCGVSLGTVKSRLSRGRKALCTILDADDNTELEPTDPSTKAALLSGETNAD